MARPQSVDLRTRVVRAVEGGASRRAAAARFEVSVSFVVKLMQRWRRRGPDKPLTNTFEDARAVVGAVRASDLVFCLTHNYSGYLLRSTVS